MGILWLMRDLTLPYLAEYISVLSGNPLSPQYSDGDHIRLANMKCSLGERRLGYHVCFSGFFCHLMGKKRHKKYCELEKVCRKLYAITSEKTIQNNTGTKKRKGKTTKYFSWRIGVFSVFWFTQFWEDILEAKRSYQYCSIGPLNTEKRKINLSSSLNVLNNAGLLTSTSVFLSSVVFSRSPDRNWSSHSTQGRPTSSTPQEWLSGNKINKQPMQAAIKHSSLKWHRVPTVLHHC